MGRFLLSLFRTFAFDFISEVGKGVAKRMFACKKEKIKINKKGRKT